MKAPFPYFGGKAPVAHIVWRALGQPAHYIEPFFGSGAVLLARKNYDPKMRIVLAGYTGEHENLKDAGWECYNWTAQGGYSNGENDNRHKEVLWMSPHCKKMSKQQGLSFSKGE